MRLNCVCFSAYNCDDADFIQNLTTSFEYIDGVASLEERPVTIQLIQAGENVEKINLYELNVEQTLFIELCGGQNVAWVRISVFVQEDFCPMKHLSE